MPYNLWHVVISGGLESWYAALQLLATQTVKGLVYASYGCHPDAVSAARTIASRRNAALSARQYSDHTPAKYPASRQKNGE